MLCLEHWQASACSSHTPAGDNCPLPVVPLARDLGVLVSNSLCPSAHINDIVAKAHKRAYMIQRAFVSRNIDLLVRAYLVYVRPLLEYN